MVWWNQKLFVSLQWDYSKAIVDSSGTDMKKPHSSSRTNAVANFNNLITARKCANKLCVKI